MNEKTYTVQFIIVKEVQVETFDDLQAERLAFDKLATSEKYNAISLLVLEPKHAGGALESEDPMTAWKFARDNFASIDKEWVSS